MTKQFKVKYSGEEFIVSISGNSPAMIEDGVEAVVREWLSVRGSTRYFNGETKREKLVLNLKIIRFGK